MLANICITTSSATLSNSEKPEGIIIESAPEKKRSVCVDYPTLSKTSDRYAMSDRTAAAIALSKLKARSITPPSTPRLSQVWLINATITSDLIKRHENLTVPSLFTNLSEQEMQGIVQSSSESKYQPNVSKATLPYSSCRGSWEDYDGSFNFSVHKKSHD